MTFAMVKEGTVFSLTQVVQGKIRRSTGILGAHNVCSWDPNSRSNFIGQQGLMTFRVIRWRSADEYCSLECISTASLGLMYYHAGGYGGAFREPKNKVKRLRLLIGVVLDRRQCCRWVDCCKPVVP